MPELPPPRIVSRISTAGIGDARARHSLKASWRLARIAGKSAGWSVITEGPGWMLTLEFGRRQAKMVVDWCDEGLRQMRDAGGEKPNKQKGAHCLKKGRRNP